MSEAPLLTIDEIEYGGWARALRLRCGGTELVLTLQVGPRVLRCGFVDGPNLFGEVRDQLGGSEEAEFRVRGGHRFWTAPEDEACYVPDNAPVPWRSLSSMRGVELVTPPAAPGVQKALRVEALDDEDGGVLWRIGHSLRNAGRAPLPYSPWAISVLAAGGVAIVPQPSPRPHPSELEPGTPFETADFWPNRRIALWPYTDLSDPRFKLGSELFTVEQRSGMRPTKLGLRFEQGWAAYQRDGGVFCKHVPLTEGATYPDQDVNLEIYTDGSMLELESLAPAAPLLPGGTAHLVEHWCLRRSTADLRDPAAARAFFASLPAVD